MSQLSVTELIERRDQYVKDYEHTVMTAVKQINMKHHAILNQSLGIRLGESIAKDLSGEIVRHYFDTSDYYITADQMYHRIKHFTYEQDHDVLKDSHVKELYNINDSELHSATQQELKRLNDKSQRKLFTQDREKDQLDKRGKQQYRDSKQAAEGKLVDELTGYEGSHTTVVRNGKEILVSDLHADHIQSREAATYNARYLSDPGAESMRQFYNSSDNFQMLHASANTSKGDVRVYDNRGQDITHRATPEQLSDAIISQWEKETASGDKQQTLKDKGYLDESGKVKDSVRKELEHNIRHSQNKESVTMLKHTQYGNVAKDALSTTARSIPKMLAGQLLYYAVPPITYEVKQLAQKKQMTLDRFLSKLKAAAGRVTAYVMKNMRSIFQHIRSSMIGKFLKSFFDILIGLVKATVKRLLKLVKSLVMSLVSCVKVLGDKHATAAQKADSIVKILGATITTIVIELLMEYAEKQFGLPNWLMEPLQIILTIIAANVVMLVLEKADLFNVKHGLLVANIRRMFEEEREKLQAATQQLTQQFRADTQQLLQVLRADIDGIKDRMNAMDLYTEDALPELERLNHIYKLDIDFHQEWRNYVIRSV